MYDFLRHAHSGFRWLVLALLIAAIVNTFNKGRSGKKFEAADRKLPLFALIATHVQVLFGFVMYFIGPKGIAAFQIEGVMKESLLRFHAVEHVTAMVVGVTLITIGFSRAKRKEADADKFRSIWAMYGMGLLLILIRIPWPFQNYGAGWF